MDWPVIIIVSVCAVAAVAVAYLVDSRGARQRRQILAEPPPGLDDTPAPAYLTEETIRSASPTPAPSPDERDRVDHRLMGVEPLSAGFFSPDFLTDKKSRRAVLESPVVVVADQVTQFLDLAPAIQAARAQTTGFVLAAREVGGDVMVNLAMNCVSGRLACVCVVTEDLDPIAALTGATIASASDLRSGYLPEAWLGRCDLWVSDEKRTWILPPPPPSGAATGVMTAD